MPCTALATAPPSTRVCGAAAAGWGRSGLPGERCGHEGPGRGTLDNLDTAFTLDHAFRDAITQWPGGLPCAHASCTAVNCPRTVPLHRFWTCNHLSWCPFGCTRPPPAPGDRHPRARPRPPFPQGLPPAAAERAPCTHANCGLAAVVSCQRTCTRCHCRLAPLRRVKLGRACCSTRTVGEAGGAAQPALTAGCAPPTVPRLDAVSLALLNDLPV